ncbi:hypothetical protein PG984_011231 [Apiospora sp. TS-2023a]
MKGSLPRGLDVKDLREVGVVGGGRRVDDDVELIDLADIINNAPDDFVIQVDEHLGEHLALGRLPSDLEPLITILQIKGIDLDVQIAKALVLPQRLGECLLAQEVREGLEQVLAIPIGKDT